MYVKLKLVMEKKKHNFDIVLIALFAMNIICVSFTVHKRKKTVTF